MTELTPELNLVKGEDTDDTADYLTIGLADSLSIIDGLFNATTGHAHNGSHQGGVLQFQDLTVGEDLVVNGTLTVVGTTSLGTLNVSGDVTVQGNLVDPRLTGQAATVATNQTLPPVATSSGRWRYYKATAAVTIAKTAGDPASCVWGPGAIAGADSFAIGNGDSVAVFCDGTTWKVY